MLRNRGRELNHLSLRFRRESRLGSPVVGHFLFTLLYDLLHQTKTRKRHERSWLLWWNGRRTRFTVRWLRLDWRASGPCADRQESFRRLLADPGLVEFEFSSDAATRDLRSPVCHEDDVRRLSSLTNSWSRSLSLSLSVVPKYFQRESKFPREYGYRVVTMMSLRSDCFDGSFQILRFNKWNKSKVWKIEDTLNYDVNCERILKKTLENIWR